MNPQIVAVIANVNMNLGHDGLGLISKKFGYDLQTIEGNKLVLFLNSARDKLKMIGPGGIVLGYVKMPKGRRLPLEAIQYIPKTFSGRGKIDLELAVSEFVSEKLKSKNKLKRMEYIGQ